MLSAQLGLAWLLVAFAHPTPPLGVAAVQDASSRPATVAPVAPGALPDAIVVRDPEPRIEDVDVVADLSEEVADTLLELSDKLRRRDFTAVATWFAPDFAGHAPSGLEVEQQKPRHLATTYTKWATDEARIVGPEGFVASLSELVTPWSRVELALWRVEGAEFQAGPGPRWGNVELFLHMTGLDANDDRIALEGRSRLEVEQQGGRWLVTRFRLDSLEGRARKGRIFTDVSTSTGVAHTGPRFGKPGNTSYAWNGAAAGDVHGTDRNRQWDIFVPSDGRNYLYVGNADGTFTEEAEARGVAQPAGGTGALFVDVDNDSDQDLVVGHVGWVDAGGKRHGHPLQLYLNDGNGKFEESGAAFGLTELLDAYSLTAFDYDLDGWVDIYACGYGRIESEHNDSWIEATNGSPNALFRNLEGKGFENVAAEAGVEGSSWSYACAVADVNRDGKLDLYVANDYGTNRLYKNDGDGTFTDVAPEMGVADPANGMGVTFGDLDGDGLLDLYVSNMSSTAGSRILGRLSGEIEPELHAMLTKLAAGNSIFLRRGNGFGQLGKEAGGVDTSWAWSTALADFDLDGRLDAFCANGFVTGDSPHDTWSAYWRRVVASESGDGARHCARLVEEGRSFSGNERDKLWFNRGKSWFEDLSDLSGADDPNDGRAVLTTDFDDDGDVDLFVHNLQGERHKLYRNDLDTSRTSFIKIQLQATTSHYEAIGATVMVEGPDGMMAQVLSRGAGFASCQAPELVFGIGDARSVRVDVAWPGGVTESFGNVRRKTKALLVETLGKPEYLLQRPARLPD